MIAWIRSGRLEGASVTAPFQEAVIPLLDELDASARGVGAVNTLWKRGDRLIGGNTDVQAARELVDELDGVLTIGDFYGRAEEEGTHIVFI